MNTTERIVMAVLIVVVDILTFGIPLTAFFAAYILIQRPVWFREWMNKVYE